MGLCEPASPTQGWGRVGRVTLWLHAQGSPTKCAKCASMARAASMRQHRSMHWQYSSGTHNLWKDTPTVHVPLGARVVGVYSTNGGVHRMPAACALSASAMLCRIVCTTLGPL